MDVLKSHLSPQRRQLVERMQQMGFGRIVNLEVRDGEPTFTRETLIERWVKFGSDGATRPTAAWSDFALKSKVIEFLDFIDAMQNGTIALLEIKGGLPFGMTVEEAAL